MPCRFSKIAGNGRAISLQSGTLRLGCSPFSLPADSDSAGVRQEGARERWGRSPMIDSVVRGQGRESMSGQRVEAHFTHLSYNTRCFICHKHLIHISPASTNPSPPPPPSPARHTTSTVTAARVRRMVRTPRFTSQRDARRNAAQLRRAKLHFSSGAPSSLIFTSMAIAPGFPALIA